jgi:hypothetical protein
MADPLASPGDEEFFIADNILQDLVDKSSVATSQSRSITLDTLMEIVPLLINTGTFPIHMQPILSKTMEAIHLLTDQTKCYNSGLYAFANKRMEVRASSRNGLNQTIHYSSRAVKKCLEIRDVAASPRVL